MNDKFRSRLRSLTDALPPDSRIPAPVAAADSRSVMRLLGSAARQPPAL